MNASRLLISGLPSAVLCVASLPAAHAADPAPAPRPPVYLSVWLAEMDVDDNPGRLEDESHSFAYGFGFGTRVKQYLDLGGDVFGASAEFDNATVSAPFFGTISDEMDLALSGILLRARGIYPIRWFEPFLGVGVGWCRAEATVSGTVFAIPGLVEEKDTGLMYEFAFGAGFVLSRKIDLVVAYRDILMEADFDSLSSGDVDIGGALYALELRLHLGS